MPHLKPEQRKAMVADYLAGMTTYQAAEKYGLNPWSVQDYLKRHGLTRGPVECHRKYSRNDAAFDVATDDAAYWVGFLMTDGCIRPHKDSSPSVTLVLSVKDADHVAAFARFLGYNGPVYAEKPGRATKGGPFARLDVKSARLCDALARFGVSPKKTHDARVSGGLELNRHFWRGCIDGDGTFGVYVRPPNRHSVKLALCGMSPALLGQFCDFACAASPGCPIRPAWHSHKYVATASDRHALALIRTLYADAKTALPRKATTAAEILGRAERLPGWCQFRGSAAHRACAG